MGAGTSKDSEETGSRKASIDSLEAAVNQGILTPEQKEKEEYNRKFRARKVSCLILQYILYYAVFRPKKLFVSTLIDHSSELAMITRKCDIHCLLVHFCFHFCVMMFQSNEIL